MYCTTQTNYQNNKECNQCDSCWRCSVCSKNYITNRTKCPEFEYGTTSKGLVQSLKNKIMNIQNESFKLKNNRKPSTKRQQDYYCLMLRKISTLDRKLQNLEDLLLTRIDYETEQALSSRASKTNNCEYLNFHNSIRSLLNLANKLKDEMVFRKHNMQFNNENSSEIHSKILALESELKEFSSYLEHLQRNGAKVSNMGKSHSQEEHRRYHNNGEVNDDYTSDSNEFVSHDMGKKYNKEPVVIRSKNKSSRPNYSNKIEQGGFQKVTPLSVNFVHSRNNFDNSSFKCRCRICSNLREPHFKRQNNIAFKGSYRSKNPKHKKVIDESDCLCYVCSSGRKKGSIRNRKLKCDEYKTNDNLSLCSCSTCENKDSKNNHTRPKEKQLFNNSAATQFWCGRTENNKDCFHTTQRTFTKRGSYEQALYNAMEVSRLQPNHENIKSDEMGNKNPLRHQFENNFRECTYSSSESSVDSLEKITNTKHFKQIQIKPTKINHKFLQYKAQGSKYSRAVKNKSLPVANNIVYYEVTQEKAKNVAVGKDLKKSYGFNEGKTKQFTNKSYKKRNTDPLAKQETLGEKRYSNVGNIKAGQTHLEKRMQISSQNYDSSPLKKNKMRKDDKSSNSSDPESDSSTKNESSCDRLQFLVCDKKSKLNSVYKHPNKTNIDIKAFNMLIKQKGEKPTKNYYNTSELFGDDLQEKYWQHHHRKNHSINKKNRNHYNLDMAGKKRNSYEKITRKTVRKNDNSSESSEAVCFTDVHYCKCDNIYKKNKNHVDLATAIKNKDCSSSNESSSLKKFADKLNEIENDVCDNCIVKEKKIKVSPHYLKPFNCKNRVKIIIKKEVIRCPECTSKLDDKVFKDTYKKPLSVASLKFNKTLSKERAEENKADNNTTPKNKDSNETNIYFEPNSKNNSTNPTTTNGTKNLGNVGAVSIFQTNLSQENMFKTPKFIQPTKLLGLQKSKTNLSTSYKKDVRKSYDKSNELKSEITSPLQKSSPLSGKINKEETSVNSMKNNSYLLNHNAIETKYTNNDNFKNNLHIPPLLIPPTNIDIVDKQHYSKNSNEIPVKSEQSQRGTVKTNVYEKNVNNNLYNSQSEIIYEMSLDNSKGNVPSYINEDSKTNENKSHNKVLSNKAQYQTEADVNNKLFTVKNQNQNELVPDTKPELEMKNGLEGNITLPNMSRPNHKKNNSKDFNKLDKNIVNYRRPVKKRNIAPRNNNCVALHNTPVYEGYNYSNNVPHKKYLNTKQYKLTPFVKKYKNFETSQCNCLSSSSTSKVSSFTVLSICNLCVSNRVGLKKPTRPTFNVGRRSSKPHKYWHISYSRPPSRTINRKKKPAIDSDNRTQCQYTCSQPPITDIVSNYKLQDSGNKFITAVTSESSFSVVNWANIAQKLKEEKY